MLLTCALLLAAGLAYRDVIGAAAEHHRVRTALAADLLECHRGQPLAQRQAELSAIAGGAGVRIPPEAFVYSRGSDPEARAELRASYTRRVRLPTGTREVRFDLHFSIGVPAVVGQM